MNINTSFTNGQRTKRQDDRPKRQLSLQSDAQIHTTTEMAGLTKGRLMFYLTADHSDAGIYTDYDLVDFVDRDTISFFIERDGHLDVLHRLMREAKSTNRLTKGIWTPIKSFYIDVQRVIRQAARFRLTHRMRAIKRQIRRWKSSNSWPEL